MDPASEGAVTRINSYLAQGQGRGFKRRWRLDRQPDGFLLRLSCGGYVTIISPASGIAGSGWRYKFKVAGIFNSGMYDYDMNLILVTLTKAQEIFDIGPTVTGIGLKLKDPDQAPKVKKEIYDQIGFSYLVRTWMETNANFFAALGVGKICHVCDPDPDRAGGFF